MMRSTSASAIRVSVVAAVLALGLACGGAEVKTEEAAGSVDVEAVATAARAVKKDPAGADAALTEAGFTRKTFEDALFLIAEDPKLTLKYAKLLQGK